jgi:hypothetical protein
MPDIEPYELLDPDRLVHEIAESVQLTEDTAWLAIVHRPSTDQRLVKVVPLGVPALLDDDDDISDDLRDAVESLALGRRPRGRGPDHLVTTIVVRPGYTLFGPNEGVWCKGWRYSNHFANAYTGDLILVTEHGWLDLMTRAAGHHPRMVLAAA